MFHVYSENVIVKTKIYLCTFIISSLEYTCNIILYYILISHPHALNVHSYEGSILTYCNILDTVSFFLSGVASFVHFSMAGINHTWCPDLVNFVLISPVSFVTGYTRPQYVKITYFFLHMYTLSKGVIQSTIYSKFLNMWSWYRCSQKEAKTCTIDNNNYTCMGSKSLATCYSFNFVMTTSIPM